jgi:hypothetical protein
MHATGRANQEGEKTMSTSNVLPTVASATPDLAAVKARQQATWATGDYAVVGTTLQIVGERICEAVDLRAGERVLDVAAGNGNATLAAARRFAQVTSTDYVGRPARPRAGARRRRAPRHPVSNRADAEPCPPGTAASTSALSTFGRVVHAGPGEGRCRAPCASSARSGRSAWPMDAGGASSAALQDVGKHLAAARPASDPSARWGTGRAWAELFPGQRIVASSRTPLPLPLKPTHAGDIFPDLPPAR